MWRTVRMGAFSALFVAVLANGCATGLEADDAPADGTGAGRDAGRDATTAGDARADGTTPPDGAPPSPPLPQPDASGPEASLPDATPPPDAGEDAANDAATDVPGIPDTGTPDVGPPPPPPPPPDAGPDAHDSGADAGRSNEMCPGDDLSYWFKVLAEARKANPRLCQSGTCALGECCLLYVNNGEHYCVDKN